MSQDEKTSVKGSQNGSVERAPKVAKKGRKVLSKSPARGSKVAKSKAETKSITKESIRSSNAQSYKSAEVSVKEKG